VNKSELVDAIAESADLTKVSASRALEGAMLAITEALKKGDAVTLVGFGSFYVSERAEREGRNPRNGEVIKIKPAKVPKFRPGKVLKDALV